MSQVTKGTLEMFKRTNSRVTLWQPNMCFEMVIQSPYANPTDYQTFSASKPPTCVSETDGAVVTCSLKSGREDTLQFRFTEVTTAQGFASLRFSISNF